MSLTIVIGSIVEKISSYEELMNVTTPRPMGTAEYVRNAFSDAFAGVTWSDATSGSYFSDVKGSIIFALAGDELNIRQASLDYRPTALGSSVDWPVPDVVALSRRHDWVAIECAGNELLYAPGIGN